MCRLGMLPNPSHSLAKYGSAYYVLLVELF